MSPRAKGPRGGTPLVARGQRSARRGGSRTVIALAMMVPLALALVGAATWWLITPRAGRHVIVRVTVPAPEGAWALAHRLADAQVVDHPALFAGLVWLTGAHDGLRAGMVPLRDDLAPRTVIRVLLQGGGLVRVTVPEGFTRFDIARRLESLGVCEAQEFLARTESPAWLAETRASAEGAPASIEGWLAPDTYDLPLDGDPETVVRRMVAVTQRRLEQARGAHPEGMARLRALAHGDDAAAARALLTLASIVERETGAPDDRARVSAVFWNRLTLPTFTPRLLQSDPTVVYGCLAMARAGAGLGCAGDDSDAGARRTITAAMLDDARNPWNTYRHEGLPPTPVCNPGARALDAALAPAATRDLYFVAGRDGRSVFAETLDAHRRNVRAWLRPAP